MVRNSRAIRVAAGVQVTAVVCSGEADAIFKPEPRIRLRAARAAIFHARGSRGFRLPCAARDLRRGHVDVKVTMRSRSKPGFAARSERSVATTSAELASTTVQIATCATVTDPEAGRRGTAMRLEGIDEVARDACQAGASPAKSAAAAHRVNVKAKTRQFTRASSATGRDRARSRKGGSRPATAGRSPGQQSPATAPRAASTELSATRGGSAVHG